MNSGLCVPEISPFRYVLQIWNSGGQPASANKRFIAYSGLVWSHSERFSPTSVCGMNGASKGSMCGSSPGVRTSVGVSTSR